jgi:hypothetical protein
MAWGVGGVFPSPGKPLSFTRIDRLPKTRGPWGMAEWTILVKSLNEIAHTSLMFLIFISPTSL